MIAEFKPKAYVGDTIKIVNTKEMDNLGYTPIDEMHEHADKTYTVSEVDLVCEESSLYYYKATGLTNDDPIFICADIAEVNGVPTPFNKLL